MVRFWRTLRLGNVPKRARSPTTDAKRVAALALVNGATLGSSTFNLDAYNFMNSLGIYANVGATSLNPC